MSVINYAANYSTPEIFSLLLDYGADPRRKLANTNLEYGPTLVLADMKYKLEETKRDYPGSVAIKNLEKKIPIFQKRFPNL